MRELLDLGRTRRERVFMTEPSFNGGLVAVGVRSRAGVGLAYAMAPSHVKSRASRSDRLECACALLESACFLFLPIETQGHSEDVVSILLSF